MEDTNVYEIKEPTLNDSDKDGHVNYVVSLWNKLNDDRSAQLALIDDVQSVLKINASNVSKNEDSFDYGKKFGLQSRLRNADFKQIRDSSIAHLYNSTIKNPAGAFSVSLDEEIPTDLNLLTPGTMESVVSIMQSSTTLGDFINGLHDYFRDGDYAYKQKQSILELIKKSRAKTEFIKAIENRYDKGESILYVSWTKRYQPQRRKTKSKSKIMGKEVESEQYQVQKNLVYDGIKIKSIEPEAFVFDTTRDDFEYAPKMYREMLTLNQITSNKKYKEYLKNDEIEELRNMIEGGEKDKEESNDDGTNSMSKEDIVEGNMIEVIDYQGDATLKIGEKSEYFENIHIVVIGRKFIACFDNNPHNINTYVYSAFEKDPDTGRGIPKLAPIVAYAIAITDILNKIHSAIGLSINKCYLAPKGMLDYGMKIEELGVIEYNKGIGDPNADIKPLDFQTALNYAMKVMDYYETKMEQFVSVFKTQQGETSKAKTLGEAKMAQASQSVLQSYEVDRFSYEVLLPTIEIIGELQASFNDKRERITYKNGQGKTINGIIDATVRTKTYSYNIEDGQTDLERKMNAMEYMNILLGQVVPFSQATGQGYPDVNDIIRILDKSYDRETPVKMIQPQGVMNGGITEGQGGIPSPVPPEQVGGLPSPQV